MRQGRKATDLIKTAGLPESAQRQAGLPISGMLGFFFGTSQGLMATNNVNLETTEEAR